MTTTTLVKNSITKRFIVNLTRDYIYEYLEEQEWKPPQHVRINLQQIYESILYPRFEYKIITSIDLGYLDNSKILGKAIPKKKVVLVDSSISPPNEDPRFPFTLGHEFGHSVLHPDIEEGFRCTPKEIFDDGPKELHDIQANIFAENLIMPDWLVRYQFDLCYKPNKPFRYIGPRDYGFDIFGFYRKIGIGSYTGFCKTLAYPLTRSFSNISKEALGLRIHKLGLVINCTDEKFGPEVRNIIKGPERIHR